MAALREAFYWTLNMSIWGTLAGILLLALRRIRRIPRLGIYLLWGVPFLRLWVPIGLESPLSLMNLLPPETVYTVEWTGEATFSNYLQLAEAYRPMTYGSRTVEQVLLVGAVVWVGAAAALLLGCAGLYLGARRQLRSARPLEKGVYLSNRVFSPLVTGILRPRILLPPDLPPEDREWVLRHERVHIRRNDNLFRLLGLVTVCLHWFNPFVWWFFRRFQEDMELACDARVLRGCSPAERKDYARSLLRCAEPVRSPMAVSFGSGKLRCRVEHILSYKRLTTAAALCSGLFLAALAAGLLTNAVK